MQRTVALLTLLLALFVLWLVWPAGPDPAPQPPGAEAPAERGPASPQVEPTAPRPRPAGRTTALDDGAWWLESLEHDLRGPLVVAADDDVAATVLRGRLTSRQRPWVHPAGVEVRLTRSWLDTVLPTEVAQAPAPERREPTATTDENGNFTLRFHLRDGELFFLIDRLGPWVDFQKVQRVPARGGSLDLGAVFVDDRGGIAGRLLDEWGQPLANATIRAVDDPLADPSMGAEDLHAERTKGLEFFRAPGAMRAGPVPDWVARRAQFLPFPVAASDEQGRFVVRGLRPGSHDLFVQHDRAHGSLRDVQVAELRDTDVGQVRLKSNTTVRLRFVDELDRPWVGASVAFVHEDLGFGPPVLHTDAHGTVQAAVPMPATARVLFAHPGGSPWIDVQALASSLGEITVTRARDVAVALADGNGVPIPGGRVRFYVTGEQFRPVDRALPEWMQPIEEQAGRHVGKGTSDLVAVASAPGFAPAMTMAGPEATTVVTMMRLQKMTVRTRDSRGDPVAGAVVRIQVHESPDHRFPGAQWELLSNDRVVVGATNAEGALEVALWPTRFSLQASHPDFASSAGPRIVPGPEGTVDLTLRRGAAIVGLLTMQQRSTPAGFRVRARQCPPAGNALHDSGFLEGHLAVTGPDGMFAFRDLCAGLWELTPELPSAPSVAGARVPASAFKSTQVLLDEGQELHCRLESDRAMLVVPQIAGVVRQDGCLMSGALLRVRKLEQGPLRPRATKRRSRTIVQEPAVDDRPWVQRLVTDHFGDFEFSGLEPSTDYEVRLDVQRDGRLQFLRRHVVRTPGHDNAPATRLDIDLRTGGMHVYFLAEGSPFANRMVRLRQALDDGSEGARLDLLTTPQGECVVEGLPAGTWTIEPTHGGRFLPGTLTVTPGQTATATMDHRP